jgi:dTDP-4-amino-4,6-dideoxygalactose transaminase
MWTVPLFDLNYDTAESAAVAAVLDSKWLTMGERVIAFESAFTRLLGGEPLRSFAVTNCTAALHMAVLAVGVGAGDEVILPALTFVADANVVRMVGARPVLADCVSPHDLTVSADDIARKITPRTKAVIVVHYAGYPCDMDRIEALCRAHRIALIEDVAHAPGGTYRGRPLGSIGEVGCFSFFSNKNLSTGEGGLVCARDPDIARRLGYLRSHGMTTLTLDRHRGRAASYDVAQPGLNYRMDEIHAALGLAQLAKLAAANHRRGELTRRYRDRLHGTPVAVPFSDDPASTATYHIMPVLLPAGTNRGAVMASLKQDGIQSSIHYPPFWEFAAYPDASPADAPVVAAVAARELTLPLFPTMTEDAVDLVCERLLAALAAPWASNTPRS